MKMSPGLTFLLNLRSTAPICAEKVPVLSRGNQRENSAAIRVRQG
jgi:hypothetical protein